MQTTKTIRYESETNRKKIAFTFKSCFKLKLSFRHSLKRIIRKHLLIRTIHDLNDVELKVNLKYFMVSKLNNNIFKIIKV